MKTVTANTKLRKRGVGRVAGTFGFLLVLSLVASLAVQALAAPVMPHQFYGNVTIAGAPAPEGTVVSARIGEVEYAVTTVDSVGRYGYDPVWKVPGDDP